MKILFVCPHFPPPIIGGLEKQSMLLAEQLVYKNIDVEVLSFANPKYVQEDTNKCLKVHRLSIDKPFSNVNLSTLFNLIKFVYTSFSKFDLVHCHTFSLFGLIFIVLSKIYRKKVVVKIPSVKDQGMPGLRSRLFGALLIRLLKHSDAVICLSQESRAELLNEGFKNKQILMAANGINYSEKIQQKTQVTKQYTIGFLGRLSDEKNISLLLEVFTKIISKNPNIPTQLLIGGDGPEREKLEKLSVQLGVKNHVKFCGFVDDIDKFFYAVDIFCLPSFAEGNSNSILEAMNKGLPIVASTAGGAEMLIGEENAEFICSPHEMNCFLKGIEKLLLDKRLRMNYGKKLNLRVKKYFRIEEIADSYIEFYNDVLRNPRHSTFKRFKSYNNEKI